jgi:PAS domain-containing protein
VQPFEKEYFRKDGSRIPALIGVTAFDEKRDQGVGFVLDLTERKQAEVALRESEQNYRMLFESIDEGFCTIEVLFDRNEKPIDYLFLQISPSFERQTGIKNAAGSRSESRLNTRCARARNDGRPSLRIIRPCISWWIGRAPSCPSIPLAPNSSAMKSMN